MKKKLVGVLGLGIFGRAVARQLSQFDQDVIAVDMKENIVNEIFNKIGELNKKYVTTYNKKRIKI